MRTKDLLVDFIGEDGQLLGELLEYLDVIMEDLDLNGILVVGFEQGLLQRCDNISQLAHLRIAYRHLRL